MLVAFLVIVLVGMTAIALDGGMLLHNKRRVQAAADAAALAGASEIFRNYPAIAASYGSTKDPGDKASKAAFASAAVNGFDNDSASADVEVNIPPKEGPFKGLTGYIEVIITYWQPRYFSTIWGTEPIPVRARAVGFGRWGATKIGIIVLDPTAQYSLDASGGGAVTVTGGATMIVDSNNSAAGRATGGGTLTADNFDITGNYVGTFTGNVETGVPPTPDPLRYLPVPPMPPAGTISSRGIGQGNREYTLTPGTFSKLPNFNPGDVVILKQASANSAGGIYYIDGGGFKSSGASIIMDSNTTGGVMIYNHPTSTKGSEGIQIAGNSTGKVNLSPLTSGPYAGILLWQDRTSSVPLSISGNGDFSLKGTFYTANAQLQITGNGNATIGSQYISRTLSLSGNGNITIDYSDETTAKERVITLVE